MDEYRKYTGRIQSERIIKALKRRQMEGYFFETKEEAAEWIINNVPKGSSVSWGDSLTLEAAGVKEHFRRGDYTVFDRDAAGENIPMRVDIMRKALSCDYYFLSSNAITLDGELVNIDGRGNRAAAICFGPEYVIFVVGVNKIAADVDSAFKRIRTVACPSNTYRHHMGTPCELTGKCAECTHPNCICSYLLVTRFCKVPGRIKVLLINEELGF